MKVVYCEKMIADIEHPTSPSSKKPKILYEALQQRGYALTCIKPLKLRAEEISLAHDPRFVAAILNCEMDNGFGNRSKAVAESLPYTSGAMVQAAVTAIKDRGCVSALVSGFHHAGFNRAAGFCTFNGLMITALYLKKVGLAERVAIIDCDYHYGDGTDDIIQKLKPEGIFHFSFGKEFLSPKQSEQYLEKLRSLKDDLASYQPAIILYQAGVDAHVDDPYGGLLTTEQMHRRDTIMFQIARELGIPIAWNLAGGYQKDPDGGISKVIDLHLNTFKESFVTLGRAS